MSITDVRADRGPTPSSPDRSQVDLAEAVQLLDDSETLRYLGQALLEQGLATDAILPLRRAVALNSTASAPRFWLAEAYRSAGQVAKADEELAALRSTHPSAERSPLR
jgi:uncharacterized protein HemY